MCVGTDRIVFAYCAPALGVNNKLRHAHENVLPIGPPVSPLIKSCILDTFVKLSAISLVVYVLDNLFTNTPSLKYSFT